MTYEELKRDFLFSNETRMAVRNEHQSYRLVKFPVAENVQLVYVGSDYTYNRQKYAFSFNEKMVLGGIIACGEFYSLHYDMRCCVEDSDNVPTITKEELTNKVSEIIGAKIVELLSDEILPAVEEDWKRKNCREAAQKLIADGKEPEAFTYELYREDISDDQIIDYLNGTAGSVGDFAKEWLANDAHKESVLNRHAYHNLMVQYYTSLVGSPNSAINVRKSMIDAVEGKKTVRVVFDSINGGTETTKIDADAFKSGSASSPETISLWKIFPEAERKRVGRCCIGAEKISHPNGYVSEMPINSIHAIFYGKKAVWTKKEEN